MCAKDTSSRRNEKISERTPDDFGKKQAASGGRPGPIMTRRAREGSYLGTYHSDLKTSIPFQIEFLQFNQSHFMLAFTDYVPFRFKGFSGIWSHSLLLPSLATRVSVPYAPSKGCLKSRKQLWENHFKGEKALIACTCFIPFIFRNGLHYLIFNTGVLPFFKGGR